MNRRDRQGVFSIQAKMMTIDAEELRPNLAIRLLGRPRIERAATRFATALINRFAEDARRTFFDPKAFAWIAPIEAEWHIIRQELDSVMLDLEEIPAFQEISSGQAYITQDRKWKTFMLRSFDYWAEENCARCPNTTRLLKGIPGLQTAFFSILEPGKHIPEHNGPYNGVLRYHLGLLIPEPAAACGIRVGGDIAHWREGGSLVFDDSHPHEAWNRAAGLRVVLFLDFVRPLRFPLSLLNRLTIYIQSLAPSTQEMRVKQRKLASPRTGKMVGDQARA